VTCINSSPFPVICHFVGVIPFLYIQGLAHSTSTLPYVKAIFPQQGKKINVAFFPFPDFSFYLVMELKPQFWITVKLRYKNDSSVTSEPVFL